MLAKRHDEGKIPHTSSVERKFSLNCIAIDQTLLSTQAKPTAEQWQNWSDNAESNPHYRKTVSDAQKILQAPPPPPPKFPQFPQGFCVDPNKVPPEPPVLPTLKFVGETLDLSD